jgi:hypothetical protein
MKRWWLAVTAACLACAACEKPIARLNAPPHGFTEEPNPMQFEYLSMVDNALLEDMTLNDVHFVPHRPMLNTLGEERLARLATLMQIYGGTIRFNTNLTDEKLIAARTSHVIDFLCDAGLDTSAELLVRDLAGGAGMDAAQAILIRTNEGTYKPKKDSSAGGGDGALKMPTAPTSK